MLLVLVRIIVDCEKSGMADMVFEMIQDADIDTRAEYYKHIVLSGKGLRGKQWWCSGICGVVYGVGMK